MLAISPFLLCTEKSLAVNERMLCTCSHRLPRLVDDVCRARTLKIFVSIKKKVVLALQRMVLSVLKGRPELEGEGPSP